MNKGLLSIFVIFVLSLSLIAILNVDAQPRTITVPDDYLTIQEAINASTDGDIIYVKKGTYYNQNLIIKKPIAIIGEDPKTTILQGPTIEYLPTKIESHNKPSFTLLNSKSGFLNFL